MTVFHILAKGVGAQDVGQWEIHTSYSLITNYTKNKNPLYKFHTNTLLQKNKSKETDGEPDWEPKFRK